MFITAVSSRPLLQTRLSGGLQHKVARLAVLLYVGIILCAQPAANCKS